MLAVCVSLGLRGHHSSGSGCVCVCLTCVCVCGARYACSPVRVVRGLPLERDEREGEVAKQDARREERRDVIETRARRAALEQGPHVPPHLQQSACV